jgi:hypothetical protein
MAFQPDKHPAGAGHKERGYRLFWSNWSLGHVTPCAQKGHKKNPETRGTKHYAQLKSVSGFFVCPFWAQGVM